VIAHLLRFQVGEDEFSWTETEQVGFFVVYSDIHTEFNDADSNINRR